MNQPPGQLNPLLRVDHIRLFVSDLEMSKAWYTKALGIVPSIDVEGYAEFHFAGNAIAVSPADAKSPVSTGGEVAYWRVAKIDFAVGYFLSHGAKLYRGPLKIGNDEAICQIQDPFGNILGMIGPV
jgi:predicted enzyme related to lactoylglutathione lyase